MKIQILKDEELSPVVGGLGIFGAWATVKGAPYLVFSAALSRGVFIRDSGGRVRAI